jgi:hypothetical protein
MELILVMLNNYQEYIIDNLNNLLRFNNKNITLITDKKFKQHFTDFNVNLVYIEDLDENYINYTNSLNNTFRNGFVYLTSYRFIAICKYMKKYNSTNILHIENDVLLYKNIDTINFHNKNKILITMDNYNRCIPGIVFIPNYLLLQECLNNFVTGKNDMENFAICYNKLNILDTLPIINKINNNSNLEFLSKNFNSYNTIFDAAAIGQYLGGIDPRNNPNETIGFINETCLIDYSKYKFIWINENNLNIPYIVINNINIPIVNLHIHSKNLKNFLSKI